MGFQNPDHQPKIQPKPLRSPLVERFAPDKAGLYELIQRNNASLSDEAPPPSSGPYQNVGGRRPSTAKPVAKASSGLAERLAAAKAKREEKQAALRSDRGSRRGTWGNPFNDPRMTGRDRNGNTVSGYAGIEDARKGWSPFGAGK